MLNRFFAVFQTTRQNNYIVLPSLPVVILCISKTIQLSYWHIVCLPSRISARQFKLSYRDYSPPLSYCVHIYILTRHLSKTISYCLAHCFIFIHTIIYAHTPLLSVFQVLNLKTCRVLDFKPSLLAGYSILIAKTVELLPIFRLICVWFCLASVCSWVYETGSSSFADWIEKPSALCWN